MDLQMSVYYVDVDGTTHAYERYAQRTLCGVDKTHQAAQLAGYVDCTACVDALTAKLLRKARRLLGHDAYPEWRPQQERVA